MPTVPNRLYAGWSPEGVEIKIIEAEMPGGGGLAGALLIANNLADLDNVVTARANLGLGGSALAPSGTYLERASNLSDLFNVATARANLGIDLVDLSLGVENTTNGTLELFGATSGSITFQPTTGALGASSVVVPAGIGTMLVTTSVNAVSPTAPDRTLTINVSGNTYYIAAKTTND